jgi:hypothetical protein
MTDPIPANSTRGQGYKHARAGLAGGYRRFYQFGQAAAIRGEPLDACPYLIDYDLGPCVSALPSYNPSFRWGRAWLRRALEASRHRRIERRDAWVQGWHVGHELRLQIEGLREQRQLPRPALECCYPGSAPPERAVP